MTSTTPSPWKFAATAAAYALAAVGSFVAATGEPISTGFSDRVGVSLILIDVEVRDDEQRPVHGLRRDDFAIELNYREHPVYSVDDLCFAGTGVAPFPRGPDPLTASADGPPPDWPVPRFVLYFDFSQLQVEGRARAVEQARRWVREIMRPEDRAMVAAFGEQAGLRQLTPFTSNPNVLLDAIDDADSNPEMSGDFAAQFPMRLRQCSNEAACYQVARQEFEHSRRALRALLTFLTGLEESPGRKALFLYHQNHDIDPARAYGLGPRSAVQRVGDRRVEIDPTVPVFDARVGDHGSLLDEIAGTAMAARTAIYPVFTGGAGPRESTAIEESGDVISVPVPGGAISFGATLADFTGGGYNRGPGDLETVVDEAGRGKPCVYRIGIRPPDARHGGTYRTRISVRGRALDQAFRVQFLSESDRWARRAEAVLNNPSAATDLPVAAAIVPLRATKKGWDVSVRLVHRVDALTVLPDRDRFRGNWEVGALLTGGVLRKSWEMLGVSQLHRTGTGDTGAEILHEQRLNGLGRGPYELRVFVRDRWANRYGGAGFEIDLPRPGRDGAVGPLVLRVAGRHLKTGLPLRTKKSAKRLTRATEVQLGPLPAGGRPVERGEPLAFLTWICTVDGRPPTGQLLRHVTRYGEAVRRFEEPRWRKAGICWTLVDEFETVGVIPGSYVYRFEWNSGDGPSRNGQAAITIVEPTAPRSIRAWLPWNPVADLPVHAENLAPGR